MTAFASIRDAVAETGLSIVGAFNPGAGDMVPGGIVTLLLLGPDGPAMWESFRGSGEAADDDPHPLDRWSERVIMDLAQRLDALAFFPFDGPPWHPFQRWAEAGEGAVISPVRMQATPERGLWASYRGALGFRHLLDLPLRTQTNVCLGCPAPCVSACPAGAVSEAAYDVAKCVAHLRSSAGAECLSGCLVRRSCPAGRRVKLPREQREFHMSAFLAAQP